MIPLKIKNFLIAPWIYTEQCHVFFVIGTRHRGENLVMPSLSGLLNNCDAMLISEITGVRTLHGRATFSPSDFNLNFLPARVI